MLPKKDITTLNMSIADGMKLIISGGAVVPSHDHKAVVVSNPTDVEADV